VILVLSGDRSAGGGVVGAQQAGVGGDSAVVGGVAIDVASLTWR